MTSIGVTNRTGDYNRKTNEPGLARRRRHGQLPEPDCKLELKL
jgi:hypothetical protein